MRLRFFLKIWLLASATFLSCGVAQAQTMAFTSHGAPDNMQFDCRFKTPGKATEKTASPRRNLLKRQSTFPARSRRH